MLLEWDDPVVNFISGLLNSDNRKDPFDEEVHDWEMAKALVSTERADLKKTALG